VVGGGVVGLACALELLRAGHEVTLLVRNEKEAASRVAGGMLAPFSEGLTDELLEFSVESLGLWREFLETVKELSNRSVFFSKGILRVAKDERELDELKKLRSYYLKRFCSSAELAEGEELGKLYPKLSEKLAGGVFYEEEGNVDTEELTEALFTAFLRLGGELRREGALRVNRDGERVLSVKTHSGKLEADYFVFAAGAWTKELFDVPVFPVKGQIARAELPPDGPPFVVYARDAYLIPREKDLLLGATTERAGFDARPTVKGASALTGNALSVLPALEEAEFYELRVGFRPGTPDGKPVFYFGENFALVSGHYRNGILHAPLTARLVFLLIERREVSPYFQKFSPYRFRRT